MKKKIYITFSWDCGFVGTDGYAVEEYDQMPSEKELDETARTYMEENCTRECSWAKATDDEIEGYLEEEEW